MRGEIEPAPEAQGEGVGQGGGRVQSMVQSQRGAVPVGTVLYLRFMPCCPAAALANCEKDGEKRKKCFCFWTHSQSHIYELRK